MPHSPQNRSPTGSRWDRLERISLALRLSVDSLMKNDLKKQSKTYGIYVHAPWCRYRCPYCAFNIYTSSNPQVEEWKDNVLRDWAYQCSFFSGEAESLYIGGGTPSRLPASVFRSLIPNFPLVPNAEIGIEVNPDDASVKYLKQLIDIGFNRFSLGIQSLQRNNTGF